MADLLEQLRATHINKAEINGFNQLLAQLKEAHQKHSSKGKELQAMVELTGQMQKIRDQFGASSNDPRGEQMQEVYSQMQDEMKKYNQHEQQMADQIQLLTSLEGKFALLSDILE